MYFRISVFFNTLAKVDYPVAWVEGHTRAFADQVERLARVLDVYTERFEEGANFRSSLLKKEPLLQYVATNLHVQVGLVGGGSVWLQRGRGTFPQPRRASSKVQSRIKERGPSHKVETTLK